MYDVFPPFFLFVKTLILEVITGSLSSCLNFGLISMEAIYKLTRNLGIDVYGNQGELYPFYYLSDDKVPPYGHTTRLLLVPVRKKSQSHLKRERSVKFASKKRK